MSELFLVGARRRRIYGDASERAPSRFLFELPDTGIEREDAGPDEAGDFDDGEVDVGW